MKLSIIIVSWNVQGLLKECLNSVFQFAPQFPFEVLVVDNASSDGSAEMVSTDFQNVSLIINAENRGFAAACNQGIKQAKGEYILLLNCDCRVTERALDSFVRFMDEHPRAGIAGCRITNPDGSIQQSVRRFPTILSQLLILFKIHHIVPRLNSINNYFATDFDYSMPQQIDQPMGAAFLIRKSLLDTIGLFDERFFIWFEEVDLCRRAREAGWEIWYDPESIVVHHGGQSFKQKDVIQKQIYMFTSCAQYLWKHFGWKSSIAVFCMRSYVSCLKAYRCIITPRYSFFWKSTGGIVALEFLSLAGYFFASLQVFGFIFLAIAAFVLSLKRLEYGIWMIIAELAIGSKGHLFSLPLGSHDIGIRIGIFSAVFLAWIIIAIRDTCKKNFSHFAFLPSAFAQWYALIGVAVISGVAIGIWNGNELNTVYADANSWIFFLITPIAWDAIRSQEQFKKCAEVFIAASAVRIATVLSLFYVMGHKGFGFDTVYSAYRWARSTGLAEITQFDFSVSRIFLQSQIYDLVLLCILAACAIHIFNTFRGARSPLRIFFQKKIGLTALIVGVLTSLIVSLSRSFWIAAIAAAMIFAIAAAYVYPWKSFARTAAVYVFCVAISLIVLFAASRLPFPATEGGFAFDLLAKRVSDLDTEAAAASRWSLLPVLVEAIQKEPVFGYGFGKTVTYYSQDPRVLETNPTGAFTTYVFEWGYLDILIKFGFVGFAVYLLFLGFILKKGWQRIVSASGDLQRAVHMGLWCGFIALLVTHIFSPYLNHPLGIGYIVAYSLYIDLFQG